MGSRVGVGKVGTVCFRFIAIGLEGGVGCADLFFIISVRKSY